MPGPFFTVPRGTSPAKCRYCPAVIYMVRQPSGRFMPVDCNTTDGWPPLHVAGRGVSHFSTCPGADTARRPRP